MERNDENIDDYEERLYGVLWIWDDTPWPLM
jgi:hypothetical protein